MAKPKVAPPEFYFDGRGQGYWIKTEGRFLAVDKGSMSLHLRYAGYSEKQFTSHNLNEVEQAILMSQKERAVDYAGPLAGHRCGKFKTSSGKTVLVTQEPRGDVFEVPMESRKPLKYLDRFCGELLDEEQLPFFWLWLKFARQSLRAGDFRPGQLIALAGPSGCGKSLLHSIITEFLGGRAAKPYRYMMGETTFNADLAGSEHLYLEDEHGSTSTAARRKFGTAIKDLTVNKEMSIHAKGREALTLPTFRRVSLSVNDESENLMVIPPLDESLLDKVMLFKCHRVDFPALFKCRPDDLDRNEIWEKLTAELPALAHMLHGLRCPKEMADPLGRYGVRAFHNSELLEILGDLAPETRLANLIDEIIFAARDKKDLGVPWTGSAEELERCLRNSPFGMQVQNLLYFPSACGTYLARLASKSPRYEARKSKGKTHWTIRQPAE
jgi:hypothetical protein